jgi:F-type H+-transporting ATPase subunit gamma
MTALAEFERHISAMGELGEIVGAMRSLAGMRIQEAQRALAGARRYAGSLAAGLGAALTLLPEPPVRPEGKEAFILCLAEHGFVGGFNERIIDAAGHSAARIQKVFVLGSRGAALAQERGVPVHWSAPMATQLSGVPDVINALAAALYGAIVRGEFSRVTVLFSHTQGGTSTIDRRQLLPIDWSTLTPVPLQPPLHNLTPSRLLEQLVAEYVFARLTEAAVESIASENAARFAAMESAHENVTKKLAQLQLKAHQARQEQITDELLDLITGAEAQKGGAVSRTRPATNNRT